MLFLIIMEFGGHTQSCSFAHGLTGRWWYVNGHVTLIVEKYTLPPLPPPLHPPGYAPVNDEREKYEQCA